MDQIKIGKFISERRKKEGLTQMQLAEKLNITDRAVSKWETGRSLPDSSIMLDLCAVLKINVNDLLCGEVVTMENYNKKTEEHILEMIKQKEEKDKQLLLLEWVLVILSLLVLFIPMFIGVYLPIEKEWLKYLIIFAGVLPFLVGLSFAIRIEQSAGYYECRHCKHRYVPTFRAVFFAMHMGRTRYMRCPKCNKCSWQKKVIGRE